MSGKISRRRTSVEGQVDLEIVPGRDLLVPVRLGLAGHARTGSRCPVSGMPRSRSSPVRSPDSQRHRAVGPEPVVEVLVTRQKAEQPPRNQLPHRMLDPPLVPVVITPPAAAKGRAVRIAVTCLQLIRGIDDARAAMEEAGFELPIPEIRGQHLEGDALVAVLEGCVVAGDDHFTADVLARLPDLRGLQVGRRRRRDRPRGRRGAGSHRYAGHVRRRGRGRGHGLLLRQLHAVNDGVKRGQWPKPAGRSAKGLRMGIAGPGGIGRALARRAAAALVGVAPIPLDELLSTSDVVSLHCPLAPETHHLLDADRIAAMKPGAFVVNTGRGALIDTEALAGALRSRRVTGAALDVLEEEPPGPSDPIRAADNAVLGSRNASNTLEASARTHREALASPSSRPRGSLRVRRVVVTGARGGIGRAAAAAFTQRSWWVIGVDNREPGLAVDRFERVDPGSDGEVAKLFGRLSGEGPLAALVNNAAIGLDKPLRDTTGDDWKRLMDVNLRSAFQCVREARRFLAAANGAVVNVGSVHAIATSANAAVYAVTKGALCALTRAAALELAADGVRCNAPGAVDTPMLRDRLSRRPRGPEGNFRDPVARTPLGFVASPEQIAPTIRFLADGEQTPYMTGQAVGGGATLRLATE